MHRNCFCRLGSAFAPALFLALSLSSMAPRLSAQWHAKDTEWPSYTADVKGSRYRPLDQINASNFNKLEVAWRFKTAMLISA